MSWVIEQDQLHITVGSSPQATEEFSPKLDLDSELQMVKSALLYADHATLCSPVASVFAEFLDMEDLSTSQKLAFFDAIPGWFPGTPVAEQAKTLHEYHKRARSRRYSKKGQETLRGVERAIVETWPALAEGLRGAITHLGGADILVAVESGLLNIHKFEAPLKRIIDEGERRSFVEEFVSVVGETVSDRSTFPLFDEEMGSLISLGIKAGRIPVSEIGIAHGKEVGLAADIFKRLPLFPRASVKEVLDIRRELEGPLLGFRSAMIKFSKEIKDASWDDDFNESAQRVFRQEVAPAVLTIEQEVNSNRFMMELTERLNIVGAAGFSILAVSMSNLPPTAVAALALGATVATATMVQAYRRFVKDRQIIEQNQLYFYYKAGQFLRDGTYEYRKDK